MENKEIIEKVLNDFAERNQYSNWKSVLKDKQSLSFEAKEFEEEIEEAIEKALAEKDKDILTARRCLNFKLIKCNNKDCKNLSCPLNRRYDE